MGIIPIAAAVILAAYPTPFISIILAFISSPSSPLSASSPPRFVNFTSLFKTLTSSVCCIPLAQSTTAPSASALQPLHFNAQYLLHLRLHLRSELAFSRLIAASLRELHFAFQDVNFKRLLHSVSTE